MTRSHQHTNGHWNESREYACGRRDEYSPNFMSISTTSLCSRTDAAREHEAAIASATNDVRDYVSHIEGLTDKEKMGILSNLGWKFEPAVLLNRPRHD